MVGARCVHAGRNAAKATSAVEQSGWRRQPVVPVDGIWIAVASWHRPFDTKSSCACAGCHSNGAPMTDQVGSAGKVIVVIVFFFIHFLLFLIAGARAPIVAACRRLRRISFRNDCRRRAGEDLELVLLLLGPLIPRLALPGFLALDERRQTLQLDADAILACAGAVFAVAAVRFRRVVGRNVGRAVVGVGGRRRPGQTLETVAIDELRLRLRMADRMGRLAVVVAARLVVRRDQIVVQRFVRRARYQALLLLLLAVLADS